MKRKDREITSIDAILEILQKSEIIRIALIDGDKPYILPMNFGFVYDDKLSIYLHGAKKGRKIDLISANNNIAFETDIGYGVVPDEKPEKWTYKYSSIVGNGKAYILDKPSDKIIGLNAIMSHSGYDGVPEFSENAVNGVAVIKIEVTELTGKSNLGMV